MELLSFGMFLAFAIWAASGSEAGCWARSPARAATGYTTLSIGALGIGDALAYRAGHGMDVQLATTLSTSTKRSTCAPWFLAVFYLLAVAPMAIAAGRRMVGVSAIGVSLVILATTAASLDNLGQMSNFLWLLWIIGTSVSLARDSRTEVTQTTVALA